MNENDPVIQNALASVPIPSADLITYRFDQTDKKFEELNKKLDKFTTSFATKEELAEVWRTLDNFRWYWRSIFGAFLICVGGIIVALIQRR